MAPLGGRAPYGGGGNGAGVGWPRLTKLFDVDCSACRYLVALGDHRAIWCSPAAVNQPDKCRSRTLASATTCARQGIGGDRAARRPLPHQDDSLNEGWTGSRGRSEKLAWPRCLVSATMPSTAWRREVAAAHREACPGLSTPTKPRWPGRSPPSDAVAFITAPRPDDVAAVGKHGSDGSDGCSSSGVVGVTHHGVAESPRWTNASAAADTAHQPCLTATGSIRRGCQPSIKFGVWTGPGRRARPDQWQGRRTRQQHVVWIGTGVFRR